jgi:putative transposase
MQGSLSIERMCQLAGVSRAGFYRSLQEEVPAQEDMEVRSAIQQIAVEHRRRYGYRRISAELRRRGMLVNHKRVLRIIREDNLLAVQPRAFVVTTDSDHGVRGLSESCQPHETDWDQSALGGRHHLHPLAS